MPGPRAPRAGLRARLRERRLPRRTRHTLLTAHIGAAVGLLGDAAGFLAVAVRATTTGDSALEAASYELLRTVSYLFASR